MAENKKPRNSTPLYKGFFDQLKGITKRRRAAEVPQEHEKVAEAAQAMIAVVDRNYRYLMTNSVFLKYNGMTREQVVGRSVAEVLGKDAFERVVKKYLDACFQGEAVQYTMKRTYPGLGERDLWVSYIPIEGPAGVDRVSSVIYDMTESLRTRAALEQAIQRSELVALATQDAVFDWDLIAHEIWRNENYQRLFGAPERSLDSDNWWTERLHPQDRERVVDAQRAALDGEANLFSSEFRLRRPDGSYADVVERSFIVRDGQGQVARVIGALTDISERKRVDEALRESEERYRGLFENSLEGMGLSKGDEVVDANRALLDIFGYSDLEEFRAISILDHVAPESRSLVKEIAERRRRGEPCPKRFEYQITRKDGETRTLEISMDAVCLRGQSYIQSTFRDITERRRAEEALRESEVRFRAVFENAGIGMGLVDLKGNSIETNPATQRMLGYKGAELKKLPYREYTHPDDWKVTWDLFQELAEGKRDRYQIEKRYIRRDGQVLWGRLTESLVRNPNGEPQYIIAMLEDVTERKRAEEALRESEQRYKDFITHSNESVWRLELDPPLPVGLGEEEGLRRFLEDAYFAECNLAFALSLGFRKPEELVGKRPGELISPTDTARLESFRSTVRAGFQSRTVELQGLHRDGKLRNLVRTEVPIVENGMLVRLWGITRDVTELRQAEEALRGSEARFRAVFENAAIGIALVDMQGHAVDSNPALQRMLGYNGRELAQMAFTEFTHPEDARTDWGLFSELVEGRRDKYHMDKRYVRKDGEVIWGGLTVSLVRNQTGEPQYVIGMVEDITERKRAEAAVRQMSGRLLRLQDEERRRIARELHDTTAQSLAALAINLSVAKESASQLNPRARACLVESLELAEQTSREIRTVSYLLHPPLLDEVGLGLALRWYVEGYAQRTGIEVDLEVPPEPARFPAEIELALYRVAQEALTNIHLHSGSKKAHVSLKCDRAQAVLSVADEGRGLPPGLLQRGGRQGGKLGVGISGMRERIRQLGGLFEIVTESKGTTLKAVVPLREEPP